MVKDRFEIIMIKDDKIAAFHKRGSATFIRGPIIKIFKGIVYHYVCTRDSIYSTDNLQRFDP